MSCTLLECYGLSSLLWANRKVNCRPALLRSPKGKSHYVSPAIPWARLSVILYGGWIQWQLPNITGRTHLLHAKRTKCPAMLYWHHWWSHGTQLVLCCVWVCLKRIILHDKHIPWMLSSIHWKPSLHSGPWLWCLVSFMQQIMHLLCLCPSLSFYVSLNNLGRLRQFQS